MIYPEYIPGSLVQVNKETALEVLDKNLSGNAAFDFSTAWGALNAGKKDRLVYYKAYDGAH